MFLRFARELPFLCIITLFNLYEREVVCEPPEPSVPFQVFWNAKTEKCAAKFGIKIEDELRRFGVVVNPGGDGWTGENTTIFPRTQLGYYPYVADNGSVVYGGVPQAVNLTKHLAKVRKDIEARIPGQEFIGLGIIDWEAWRPVWDRDWDTEHVYQNLSEKLVRDAHPDWDPQKVATVAKERYETAAKEMMLRTVQTARSVRPDGQWGYYLFPHCYSHGGERHCPEADQKWNDQLSWLFNASPSLFPSAYFSAYFNSTQARNLVYGEVNEARRVRGENRRQQIYLYSRITYREGNHDLFYTKADIYNSIGMAAMLGASGVVLWDDNIPAHNLTACGILQSFVSSTLGPGVTTASEFASMCSRDLCSGHGRCVMPTAGPNSAEQARRLVDRLTSLHGSSLGGDGDRQPPSSLSSLFRKQKQHSKTMTMFQATWPKPSAWPATNYNKLKFQPRMEEVFGGDVVDFGCDCFEGYSGYHCENPATQDVPQVFILP